MILLYSTEGLGLGLGFAGKVRTVLLSTYYIWVTEANCFHFLFEVCSL